MTITWHHMTITHEERIMCLSVVHCGAWMTTVSWTEEELVYYSRTQWTLRYGFAIPLQNLSTQCVLPWTEDLYLIWSFARMKAGDHSTLIQTLDTEMWRYALTGDHTLNTSQPRIISNNCSITANGIIDDFQLSLPARTEEFGFLSMIDIVFLWAEMVETLHPGYGRWILQVNQSPSGISRSILIWNASCKHIYSKHRNASPSQPLCKNI